MGEDEEGGGIIVAVFVQSLEWDEGVMSGWGEGDKDESVENKQKVGRVGYRKERYQDTLFKVGRDGKPSEASEGSQGMVALYTYDRDRL